MNSFRLRMRPLLLLAAIAMALVVASGIAWAATIQCPNQPDVYGFRLCEGTDEADVMYGTAEADAMYGLRGADTLYGRGGNDGNGQGEDMSGGRGPDDVYGGGGDDVISDGCSDCWYGADENYSGRGNDEISGSLAPDRHSGGPGDDLLMDYQNPSKYADVFRCGDGYDEVIYNQIDRVAADCEVLRVWPPS